MVHAEPYRKLEAMPFNSRVWDWMRRCFMMFCWDCAIYCPDSDDNLCSDCREQDEKGY